MNYWFVTVLRSLLAPNTQKNLPQESTRQRLSNDLNHEDSADCWCNPTLAHMDRDTMACVWVHRTKDEAH